MGDLAACAESPLKRVFQDAPTRELFRSSIYEAFGLYAVVDPTLGGTLRLRLSDAPPASIEVEQGLHPSAVEFHRHATHIVEMGDGVKAYAGIVLAVVAAERRIVLIDEAEAFLHPPLARRLGRFLSSHADRLNGHVLAATHSPDFLASVPS